MPEVVKKVFFFVCLLLGFAFALASLGLGISCMVDSRWIYYDVGLVTYLVSIISFSRYRGMFMECLVNKNAQIITTTGSNTKFGNCFELQLGQNMPTDPNWNFYYISGLRASHIGTFSAALFCVFVAILVSFGAFITWCCTRHGARTYRVISIASGVIFLLAAFCYIASILLLHITLDEEKMRDGTSALATAFYQWPPQVRQVTTMSYSVMYFIAWAACGASLLAALLFFLSNCCYTRSRKHPGHGAKRLTGMENPTFVSPSDFGAMKENPHITVSHEDVRWASASMDQRKLPRYTASTDAFSGKNIYRIY